MTLSCLYAYSFSLFFLWINHGYLRFHVYLSFSLNETYRYHLLQIIHLCALRLLGPQLNTNILCHK